MITSAKDKLGKTVRPNAKTSSTSIKFTFTSSDNTELAGCECKLDSEAFASCASPVSYAALAKGTHTFQVRAEDGGGLVDPTPAVFTRTVTTKAVK